MLCHLKCATQVWSIVGADAYVHWHVAADTYTCMDRTPMLNIAAVNVVLDALPHVARIHELNGALVVCDDTTTHKYMCVDDILVPWTIQHEPVVSSNTVDPPERSTHFPHITDFKWCCMEGMHKFAVDNTNVVHEMNASCTSTLSDLGEIRQCVVVARDYVLFVCVDNVCVYLHRDHKWQLVHALQCNGAVYYSGALYYVHNAGLYRICFQK